ncbi:MAG: hypothetical protein HY706_09835 [Candidatus Hydrogenedentes bacterium]|nr:hypothetical protein [Candidatus Hydrogenedentota bacterium]
MLGQLAALLWLRFLLLRHLWVGSATRRFSFILMAIVGAVLTMFAFGLAVGLFVLGMMLPVEIDDSPAASLIILAICDCLLFAFLLFWGIGLSVELQRSESIDFRKMLYLPVSLRMVFLLNFCVSLLSPAAVFFLLPSIGLLLGLSVGFGPLLLLGIPLAVLFYLSLAAWTYYLRGLLAILMENKRRRRLILVVLPLVFVVVGQLPYLLTRTLAHNPERRVRRAIEEASERVRESANSETGAGNATPSYADLDFVKAFVAANQIIPLGWLPYGIYALIDRNATAGLLCFLGVMAIGGLGLGVGYRSTVNYYVGKPGRERAAPAVEAKTAQRRTVLTARTLPWLADDTTAFAWAAFLTYLRHPQIRVLVASNVIFGLIFGLAYLPSSFSESTFLSNMPPAFILVWPMLGGAGLLFNLFGVDGAGFRALVLLPASRRKYLLAKNIALFPFVGGMCVLFLLLTVILLRSPARSLALACLQVFQLYFLFCAAGNFMSIVLPFRMSPEAMRNAGKNPMFWLVGMASFVLFSLLMVPTAVCVLLDFVLGDAWGIPSVSWGLIASLVTLTLTAIAYKLSLGPAGTLLQNREQKILDTLTRDRE